MKKTKGVKKTTFPYEDALKQNQNFSHPDELQEQMQLLQKWDHERHGLNLRNLVENK